MRRFNPGYLLIIVPLLLFSCRKDKSSTAPNLLYQKQLVGIWTLQQEHYTQFIDGQKQIDTTINATDYNRAYVKFNSNGTFSSAGLYTSPNSGLNLNQGGMITAADSTSGTFSYTGSSFSLSEPIAGLATSSSLSSINVTMGPVITPVSHLISISQVTTESLKIHSEYIYTYTVNSSSQTYKMNDDYYYTK